MEKASKFLEDKYLKWQIQQGGRGSQSEFAKYLGVQPATLSHWLSGTRKPDYQSCVLLSDKLGDEIFIICDFLPPDEKLRYIITSWSSLADYAKQEIEAILEKNDKASIPMSNRKGRTTRSKISEIDPKVE